MTLQARIFIALGALSGALCVALSAAAAHMPDVQRMSGLLQTSLTQQQLHALGMIAVGGLMGKTRCGWLTVAGCLMLLGTVLFCFNIQARVLWGWDLARALVPWGGSAFILGWLSLVLAVLWPHPEGTASDQ